MTFFTTWRFAATRSWRFRNCKLSASTKLDTKHKTSFKHVSANFLNPLLADALLLFVSRWRSVCVKQKPLIVLVCRGLSVCVFLFFWREGNFLKTILSCVEKSILFLQLWSVGWLKRLQNVYAFVCGIISCLILFSKTD